MKIYKLHHAYTMESGCITSKMIGFYSSKLKAEKKILEYQNKPGFCEKPNDFFIKKFLVKDFTKKIYWLTFSFEDKKGCDDDITIGVYSSIDRAKKNRINYIKDNKLNKNIDGLCIEEYVLNKDEWTTGYFNPFDNNTATL